MLPGTLPVLDWFAAEQGFAGATHSPRSAAATLKQMSWLDDVKWDATASCRRSRRRSASNDVLMLAFMNREALARTAELGEAVYWSRSRERLWHKGEESGNVQKVHELRLDCDNDVVLLEGRAAAAAHGEPSIACHTGRHSCFFQRYANGAWQTVEPVLKDPGEIYR